MSAARNIRDVVSNARSTVSPDDSRAQTPDTVPTNRNAAPLTTVASEPVLNSKNHIPQVMDFINKLSAATLQNPRLDLTTLLSDLGFDKGGSDDDDDSLSSSSSSFSFNIDTSTGSSFGGIRSLKSQLANFSTLLAQRSWIENNRDLYADTGDLDHGELERSMVPYRGAAAVMFVDLSGYSKIASALTQSGGAHALSTAVNAYFEAILGVVVDQYDGEVLTFAGDAIVVCWTADPGIDDLGSPQDRQEEAKRQCCVLAAACALDLQRKCGMSPVPGTELFFRLHIGITYGELESQVFVCPGAQTMQKAYHFVSGIPLQQTASVVSAAQQGEICVTEDVRRSSGGYLHLKELRMADAPSNPVTPQSPSELFGRLHLLTGIDDDYRDAVVRHKNDRTPVKRSTWLETNLVPPAVAKKLKQGFKASHVAEMRFLCVLFIRKLDDRIGAAEWFNEVQQILDESRCPIVQVLDDDKGMHVVAAVNLYVTERSPATVGILAARKLMERETGCAIGMACGEVFCGITGSTSACRFDMTGPTCVLAARLMQHSVTAGIPTCIAPSVFASTGDVSQLEPVPEKVLLKGSPEPITIFTLSETSISATAGIMNVAWATEKLHVEQRKQLSDFFNARYQRGVAMVSGPVGSGKKTLISMMLERGSFMSVVHEATRERTPLSVVAMLGEWFAFHEDKELSTLGLALTVSLKRRQVARTLSLSLQLIQLVIEKGIRCCLVVAYAHLLDASSMSFIKAAMSVAPSVTGTGKFYVVLTAYMLYGATPVDQLVSTLQRGLTEHEQVMRRVNSKLPQDAIQREVLHVKVEYAKSPDVFAEGISGVAFFHPNPKTAQVCFEATGGCLSLIPPLVQILAANQAETESDPRKQIAPAGTDGMIHMTQYGEDYLYTQINWPRAAPEVSARFTELYDALPPRYQLVLRVIASLSSIAGSANIFHVSQIMEKLSTKFTTTRTVADIRQLVEYDILMKADNGDGDEVNFTVPVMIDVVGSLVTPDQDVALKRQAFKSAHDYYVGAIAKARERSFVPDDEQDVKYFPVLSSFVARLARAAGSLDVYKRCLMESWEFTLMVTGPQGALDPDLRLRMEQRLGTEARRNPEHATLALFERFEVKPLLTEYRSQDHYDPVHHPMTLVTSLFERGHYIQPPIALAAISGEVQKMVWGLLNDHLDHTKPPNEKFLEPGQRQYLRVDIDAYMAVIEKFEGKVPKSTDPPHPSCPKTLAEEKALITFITSYAANVEGVNDRLVKFFDYYDHVIMCRRDRLVKFVQSISDIEAFRAKGNSITAGAMKSAFALFVRPPPIPSAVVHKALLVLATAGWQTKYFSSNLQSIRDAVLRQRTATEYDFKAFLFCNLAFGEEITSATMRAA